MQRDPIRPNAKSLSPFRQNATVTLSTHVGPNDRLLRVARPLVLCGMVIQALDEGQLVGNARLAGATPLWE